MRTRFFVFVVFVWLPGVALVCNLLADTYAERIAAAAPIYQLAMFYGFLALMSLPFVCRALWPRKRRSAP